MSLGKSFGKLRQWTGEKLGASNKTEVSEEFRQLEQETEAKRIGLERLFSITSAYTKGHSKKVENGDGSGKSLAVEALGNAFTFYAENIGVNSEYRRNLIKFGETHGKIGQYQLEYVSQIRQTYLTRVESILADHKEYTQLRKKLESRRLDFDAKAGRLQNAKKEKPELEESVRVAQAKYEETLADTAQKMVFLHEAEEEHCRDLNAFLEAEIEYYKACYETILTLQGLFGESIARTAVDKNQITNLTDVPIKKSVSSRIKRRDEEEDGRIIRSNNSRGFINSNKPPSKPLRTPSAPGDSGPSKPQVKAMFDFEAESADELRLRVGDVITVLEKVDEGWLIGEIADDSDGGNGRRVGMFPSNYVEPYAPPTPMASPQTSLSLSRQSSSLAFSAGASAARRASLADRFASNSSDSSNGDAAITISANSSPFRTPSTGAFPTKNEGIGRRPAPLPPSNSNRNAAIARSATRFTPSSSTPGTPPIAAALFRGGVPRSTTYAYASRATHISMAGGCSECGCDDFTENRFKKGHCNNCFHRH